MEKMRPTKLDQIIGHDNHMQLFYGWNETHTMPHLLLHGTWGVGKSAMMRAAMLEYYGRFFDYNVRFINASRKSERNIENIEKVIKKMGISPRGDQYSYRVFIFDEADQLTDDAELSLKEAMIDYSEMAKVVLITNHQNKIDGGLRSRCTPLYFPNPEAEVTKEWIEEIYHQEVDSYSKCQYTREELFDRIFNKIVTPRDALKQLEYYFNGGFEGSLDEVSSLSRLIMKKFINSIDHPIPVSMLLKTTVEIYYNIVSIKPGVEREIVRFMFDEAMVHFSKRPRSVGEVSLYMTDVDTDLRDSINPNIHMVGMLTAFSKTFGKKSK